MNKKNKWINGLIFIFNESFEVKLYIDVCIFVFLFIYEKFKNSNNVFLLKNIDCMDNLKKYWYKIL